MKLRESGTTKWLATVALTMGAMVVTGCGTEDATPDTTSRDSVQASTTTVAGVGGSGQVVDGGPGSLPASPATSAPIATLPRPSRIEGLVKLMKMDFAASLELCDEVGNLHALQTNGQDATQGEAVVAGLLQNGQNGGGAGDAVTYSGASSLYPELGPDAEQNAAFLLEVCDPLGLNLGS